jgi:hypothetical protein
MMEAPTISLTNTPTYQNCSHESFNATVDGFIHRVNVSATGTFRAYGGIYEADAEL